ncbi:MAG TPA: hypothetical protein VFW71_08140 [Actinomycetota bacterium]|nr:hypothetical protein [Actinomycetota bacterium]
MAAQLWGGPGTVISHEPAGALFGLDGVPTGGVAITSRRGEAPEGVKLHRSSSLQPWEYGPLDPSPDPLSNPWEPTLAESLRVTGVVRTLMAWAAC